MKELNNIEADKLAFKQEAQIKETVVLKKSILNHKGLTLFEINTDTFEVCEAEYESVGAQLNPDFIGGVRVNKVVRRKQNCAYVLALNKKNAMRKFNQRLLAIHQILTKNKKQ